MSPVGDMKYEVECIESGKHFYVDSLTSKVPKHPRGGENPESVVYVPCAGSGVMGRPIRPHIVGRD